MRILLLYPHQATKISGQGTLLQNPRYFQVIFVNLFFQEAIDESIKRKSIDKNVTAQPEAAQMRKRVGKNSNIPNKLDLDQNKLKTSPSETLEIFPGKRRVASPPPDFLNRKVETPSKRKESFGRLNLVNSEVNKKGVAGGRAKASSVATQDISKLNLQALSPQTGIVKKSPRGIELPHQTDAYKSVSILDAQQEDKKTVAEQSITKTKPSRKSQGNIVIEDPLNVRAKFREASSHSTKASVSKKKDDKSNVNLNLNIPSINIENIDLRETKPSSKRASVKQPILQNQSSAELSDKFIQDETTALETSPGSGENKSQQEAEKHEIKIQPSQNSDFSFPIHYFKPIKDSTLDKYIQSINDSHRSKQDLDDDESDTQASQRKVVTESNVRSELPMSCVVPSSYLNINTSLNNSSQKGKVCQISGFSLTPRDRQKGESIKGSQVYDERKISNSLTTSALQQRSKSPPCYLVPNSAKPYQSKDGEPSIFGTPQSQKNLKGSASLLKSFNQSSSSSKLPDKKESILSSFISSRPERKQSALESDARFSNLDKLLAQLRDEARNKTEDSVENDLSLEKGLFNKSREEGDGSANTEPLANKSFAKNLLKTGHIVP